MTARAVRRRGFCTGYSRERLCRTCRRQQFLVPARRFASGGTGAAGKALGLAGLVVADRNTLAGVVRAHVLAKEVGLAVKVGCRLVFADGTPDILVWPTDRAAYGRLCRLLTLGNRAAAKGECDLRLDQLMEGGEGLLLGVVPPVRLTEDIERTLRRLREAFPGAVHLMGTMLYGAGDRRRLARLAAIAAACRTPLLASNDALFHHPDRREVQDVLTAIREHVPLAAAGKLLAANAERHLKSGEEMLRLFRDAPEAVAESLSVLQRLTFSLDELRYNYPEVPVGEGEGRRRRWSA